MMRSTMYTAPSFSTSAAVTLAAYVNPPVILRTISGSTRSHAVVSSAQKRSSASVAR